MSPIRLTLTELVLTNGGLPPAEMGFRPGLNLITGATSTGKTYIFEALNFMLGAGDPLRRVKEGPGYNRASLSLSPSNGPFVVLHRNFSGGSFKAFEYGDGRDQPHTAERTLSPRHTPKSNSSLSTYFLSILGLRDKQLRTNADGQTRSLSFRDVCHLALVSELRIIQKESPALSEQKALNAAERSLITLFLTGLDGSNANAAAEPPKQRKARLKAEAGTVTSILADKRMELRSLTDSPEALADQEVKLKEAIAAISQTASQSQDVISDLERNRQQIFEERTQALSRHTFLYEQLRRFLLLRNFYDTDHARLLTILRASQAFHELPEGTCPLCLQAYPQSVEGGYSHADVESACQTELAKLEVLRRDLRSAIQDSAAELKNVRSRIPETSRELAEIDSRLRQSLIPAFRQVEAELQSLYIASSKIMQASLVHKDVLSLEGRLGNIQQLSKDASRQAKKQDLLTDASTANFCRIVKEILEAWKYPSLGEVEFSRETFDLVIGGQHRAELGKGYRSITYAAFVIALMKHCHNFGFPHPGFIVLDTPVNPYKGKTQNVDEDLLADELKVAFFEYLANDASGDQYIIFENVQPPQHLRDRVNYFHFTGRTDLGQSGFIPQHVIGPSASSKVDDAASEEQPAPRSRRKRKS